MSDLKSWLPEGGGNLFQEIKEMCRKAEAAGKKLWRLSIGQPQGPALESARKAAAEAVMSDAEGMHEYQDNGSPGVKDFARRFVQAHLEILSERRKDFLLPTVGDFKVNRLKKVMASDDVGLLPIPGIKPMLGLIPMACGGTEGQIIAMGTTTSPGYPTPKIWAEYAGQDVFSLPTDSDNHFLFDPQDVGENTDLLMVNYPHNPSGQGATREWWRELCDYCAENDIRLFNDAAYSLLSHSPAICTLTEVAIDFPNLSWAEAFSASKVISNGTGWRVGAMVGSPDFIWDIATIKGNTDSGFVAFAAAGVIHALENDREGIEACRRKYEERLKLLTRILTDQGMRLAVEPKAGFFTLWQLPKMAFGQKINNAKEFNYLMIEKTGVVGVHFHPYIRYAVTSPIEEVEFQEAIHWAFNLAKPSY